MTNPDKLPAEGIEAAILAVTASPGFTDDDGVWHPRITLAQDRKTRATIAAFLNWLLADDAAMERGARRQNPAYDAATHDTTRAIWRWSLRYALLAAVQERARHDHA